MLLLAAGLIEGLISPIEWWPIEGKLAVSGTTLVLLVVFLRRGGSRSAPEPTAVPAHAELALGAVTARRAP
jgi:hypothetical protein